MTPTTLVFPDQPIGVASAARTITLLNTGTTALRIKTITRSSPQFSLTHTCGNSVMAGASCAVSVTFKPKSAGAKTSTLTIKAGDGAGARTVTLVGNGTPLR